MVLITKPFRIKGKSIVVFGREPRSETEGVPLRGLQVCEGHESLASLLSLATVRAANSSGPRSVNLVYAGKSWSPWLDGVESYVLSAKKWE